VTGPKAFPNTRRAVDESKNVPGTFAAGDGERIDMLTFLLGNPALALVVLCKRATVKLVVRLHHCY
jgi:hypothetical protein